MHTKMTNVYDKAVNAAMTAMDAHKTINASIDELTRLVTFKNFSNKNGHTPIIKMSGNSRIICEYYGRELTLGQILEVLDFKGYVEPSDF